MVLKSGMIFHDPNEGDWFKIQEREDGGWDYEAFYHECCDSKPYDEGRWYQGTLEDDIIEHGYELIFEPPSNPILDSLLEVLDV